jgi:hypothetical protein
MKDWSSDFRWCIENDWQVYIKPINTNHCKIAIRKGGISCNGKDMYECKESNLTLYSSEKLGNIFYKTQQKAFDALPKVYSYLRDKYG